MSARTLREDMMPRPRLKTDDESFIEGSGNVWRDLGFPHPQLMARKSELVMLIADAIRSSGLTQAKAAAVLRLDQPKVSRLLSGHFSGFSVYRLLEMLAALGQDVDIRVTPRRREAGPGTVRISMQRKVRRSRAAESARG
jgi:predicted XRE-type DNA-binding protein